MDLFPIFIIFDKIKNMDFINAQKRKQDTKPLVKGKYESQANFDFRQKITPDVISSYEEHKSITIVKKIYNVTDDTIRRILKDNNVEIIGRGYASAKSFKNPFDKNTTSKYDRAYWVGYIAGDGYIDRSKNKIQITSKDDIMIEQFKDFIKEGYGTNTTKTGVTSIYFSNKDAKDYLDSIGLTTKKSLTLKINIPITWDFIRGIFDADGSFAQNRFKITTGSLEFTDQLVSFFLSNNIQTSISFKGKISNTCDVYILGGKEVLDLVYTKLYNENCKYYLPRKKDLLGTHLLRNR